MADGYPTRLGSQGTKWQGEGVPGADVASGTVQNRVFWESPARAAKGNAHISIDSNSTGVPQRMADSSRHRLQFDVSNLCSRAVVPPQYRCMRCGTHVHISVPTWPNRAAKVLIKCTWHVCSNAKESMANRSSQLRQYLQQYNTPAWPPCTACTSGTVPSRPGTVSKDT